jgi:hypothetical protein
MPGMRFVMLVVVVLATQGCHTYQRAVVEPASISCLEVCKRDGRSDEQVFSCAAACPGSVVAEQQCDELFVDDSQDYRSFNRCVETKELAWGRILLGTGAMVATMLLVWVIADHVYSPR